MKILLLFTMLVASFGYSRTPGPHIKVEWRDYAKVKGTDSLSDETEVAVKHFKSVLLAPIIKGKLIAMHMLNSRISQTKGADVSQNDYFNDLGYQSLGFIYLFDEIYGVKPNIYLAQARDNSFSFDEPLNTLAVGFAFPSTFLQNLFNGSSSSDVLLAFRARFFPSRTKYVPVFKQDIRWDKYRLLILAPSELRLTRIISEKDEVYGAVRANDQNVLPYELDQMKAWNVDGYTASALIAYERVLAGPVRFVGELGYQMENFGIENKEGDNLIEYATEPAPWASLRLITIF